MELFWNRKITVASVLFVANRYLPLIVISLGLPNDVPVEVSLDNACASIPIIVDFDSHDGSGLIPAVRKIFIPFHPRVVLTCTYIAAQG